MTDQKPTGITDTDWEQTPPAVRTLLTQSLQRVEQLQTQIQVAPKKLEHVSEGGFTEPVEASQALPATPSPPWRRPRRTLNQLATLSLAFVIGAGGQSLLNGGSLWDGLLLYAIALFLVFRVSRQALKVSLIDPFEGLAKPLHLRSGPARVVGLFGLIGALYFSVLAYRAFGEKGTLSTAWNLYLAGLICLLAATLFLTRGRAIRHYWPNSPLVRWLLGLVFLLAVFMRFWLLGDLPAGLWYDEAISGLQGVQWNTDPAFRPQFESNDPGQLIFLYAMALRWFGQSPLAIRLVPALLGLAGVAAAYLFGHELRGPRFGLALAFFVAVARWHVNISRFAMPSVDTPLFVFLSLFFLTRLLKDGRLRDAIWAGLSLGLGLSIYSAFRLFVLATGLFVLVALFAWRTWWPYLRDRRWRLQVGTRLALLGLALWLTALPIIHFALNEPATFWARPRKVSIFTNREDPDLGKALWRTSRAHLLMFNFQGDRNGRHNLPGEPMLDPAMGVFFVLGLGLALARFRRPVNLFFLILLPVGLLGGILSLDFEAPQSQRSIAVFPAVAYFCTLSLATLGRRAEQDLRPLPAYWLAGPALILGSYIIFSNAHTYFVRQAHDFASWNAFSSAESISGQRMAALGPDYIFYLSPLFDNHPSIRFLSPDTPDRRLLTLPDALPIRQPADKPAALFIHPDDRRIYETAQRFYPAGEFEMVFDPQDKYPVLYTVQLMPEDVVALQGLELNYWLGHSWEGRPQAVERVGTIDVIWPNQVPFPTTLVSDQTEGFAAEWSGFLYAPDYGPYQFMLRGPAGALLEINGQILAVVENGGEQTVTLTLAQGNHRLRVRALSGIGQVSLLWQPPGGKLERIPQWVLYHPPVTNHGLQGGYFSNANWEGSPALSRIDPFLDTYFHLTPLPRPYSVEWTGILDVPQAGSYTLALRAVDGAELYIDGQATVVTTGPNVTTETVVTLNQGPHDLRLRFKDTVGRSRIHLLWQPPGQAALTAIPTNHLWPSRQSYFAPAAAELPPLEGVAGHEQTLPLSSPAGNGPAESLPVDQPGWSFTATRLEPDPVQGGLLLYGEVINETDSAQALTEITSTFYDDQGRVIAAADSSDAHWPVDVLPPGGHTPFELRVNGLQSATRFDIKVEAEAVDDSPRQIFRISNLDQWQTAEAYCVAGRLLIPGEALQEYLVIAVVLYDAEGAMINFGDVYERYPSEMESGQMHAFEVCVDPPNQDVARYEVQAWGE